MALARAHLGRLCFPVIVTSAFLGAACGGSHATGPSPTSSLRFTAGMYRLNVDWKPGSISLCINGPNANTGFAMDVELFAQDNQWRVRMPNGSGAASGTLTGELFTNGTAISGRIRGWGIDTAMRRIDIQPASSSVDALLSGTGQETAASGDFSGSFTAQTPGGPTFPAPCTPLGWTLTPR